MAQQMTIGSLDELVKLALHSRNDEKYLLNVRVNHEYVDREAGRQFESQAMRKLDYADAFGTWDPQRALKDLARTVGHEPTAAEVASYVNTLPEGDGLRESLLLSVEERAERYAVEHKIYSQWVDDNKPPMHNVTYYSLSTAGTGYRSGRTIEVAPELGVELVKVWKHGPRYQGSHDLEPKGYVTLAGICKRLGRSDISDQIKQAEDNAKAEQEKNSRNYVRREINDLLKKIEQIVIKDGASIGVKLEDFNLSIELSNKLEREA